MKTDYSSSEILNLWQTRKPLVLTGVLFLLAALMVLLVVLPQLQFLVKVRGELAQEQKKLDSLQAKAAELDQALFSAEFAQAEVVDRALPMRKPLLELLASLNSAVVGSNTHIESLELSPGLIATGSALVSKGGSDEGKLEVKFRVSGEFEQIEALVKRIEEFSPFTTVAEFRLSEAASDKPDKNNVISAELVTHTYYFTQTVAQTLEKPLPKIDEAHREVLRQVGKFQPSTLAVPNQVTGGGEDDPFKVEGFDEQLKLYFP